MAMIDECEVHDRTTALKHPFTCMHSSYPHRGYDRARHRCTRRPRRGRPHPPGCGRTCEDCEHVSFNSQVRRAPPVRHSPLILPRLLAADWHDPSSLGSSVWATPLVVQVLLGDPRASACLGARDDVRRVSSGTRGESWACRCNG